MESDDRYTVIVHWKYRPFVFIAEDAPSAFALVGEIHANRYFHTVDDQNKETIVPIYQITHIEITPGVERVEAVTAVGMCDECEEGTE